MRGLMKSAASLPRFTMDCGFWRTRRYVGASPAVVGLQAAAVSYCYEHGTDGWIPNDGLAAALGFKEKEVAKFVPELVRRDIWRPAGEGGFEIVGYLDHNPSRAEVRQQRALRAEASAKANHKRWHADRSDPDCQWCSESESDSESGRDSPTDSDDHSATDSQEKRREEKRREEKTDGVRGTLAFEPFWAAYPPRDGKKLGKAKAEERWHRMTDAERQAAIVGAGHLARAIAAGGKFGPPDAERWLRDRKWPDWQEPARNGSAGTEPQRVVYR